eukprot:CAMPEP_0201578826 /NCGR_PEP_ID=MMETSP0190_2-20130828/25894_1 /ASSEMBLY_ACC=CAM_ASM_000263 /TAXON_ID=37353 /ORGANISM="Rosalina sp." /LENGTH=220 /DNA_ID=CAMNT_0048012423 /DNA_START=114 /DNA_END=773 /DNA_ORIENTATION=+
MASSRKRKSDNSDDSAPATKKPKLDSMYTRTDPVTGNLGRVRKKDEAYWSNFTRRAQKKRERREREKLKREAEDGKKKAARAKAREARKKKEAEAADLSSESETDSDEDDDIKRDDKSKFVPFYNLTTRFKDHVCIVTGGGRGIGKACSLRLAQEGAIVYILDYKQWTDTIEAITEAQKTLHQNAYKDAMAKYHADCDRNKNKNKNKGTKPKKPRKVRFK